MSAKETIKRIVDSFNSKPYLKDKTREMGEGLMLGASLADESNERSKTAEDTTKRTEEKYKEQILAQDLNPNKDPELVDLRNGNATAGERITKFEQKTTAQFQQTEQELEIEIARSMLNDEQLRAYVDLLQQQLTSMGDISPEPYSTYNDLVSANPSHTGVYVVQSDGNWYYWNKISNKWDVGGKFQSSGIADNTVSPEKLTILVPEAKKSRNLFNKYAAKLGYYYRQTDGNLVSSSTRAAFVIPVEGDTRYSIQGSEEQYAFLDASDSYISGSPAIYSNRIDTPTGAKKLLFNCFIENLSQVQVEKGNNRTAYIAHAVVDKETIEINTTDMKHVSFPVMIQSDINLFDRYKATQGKYVQYNTGNVVSGANYYVSELIPIWASNPYEIRGSNQQWALYDEYGEFLIGGAEDVPLLTFDKPKKTRFIRMTVHKDNIDRVGLYNAWKLEPSNITDNALTYIGQRLSLLPKVIKVAKDGTGNYTTLRSAIQNATTGTTIELGDGEYSINEEYSVAEINDVNFKGYVKDRGISIKAVNSCKATLSCDLSSADFPDTTRNRVSTLNTAGGGGMNGLIVRSKKTRYSLHDDSIRNNFDTVTADYCKFYQVDGQLGRAVGGGTWNGSNHIFDHCHFATDAMDVPIDYHNNIGFTKPSRLKLVDCTFHTPYEYQLRLQSLNSGTTDEVELIGNRLSKIEMTQNAMDYHLLGRGNRPLTLKTVSQSLRPTLDFVEEVTII